MSIPLAQLLELSYDLAQGRKRRHEWETHAEVVTVAPEAEPEATQGLGDDATEMELLHASLRDKGLTPRAPDAEHAFLRLVCADHRSAKSRKLEGSVFDWMTVPPSAQGPAEFLCPPKAGSKALDSDDICAHLAPSLLMQQPPSGPQQNGSPIHSTVHSLHLLAVSGLSASEDEDKCEPFTPPSDTDVARSPAGRKHIEDLGENRATSTCGGLLAALERLSDLVSYDLHYRHALSICNADLSEEDVQFCAEVTQEALAEAERDELLAEQLLL